MIKFFKNVKLEDLKGQRIKKMNQKIKVLIIVLVVLVISLGGALGFYYQKSCPQRENFLSSAEAGKRVVDFVNEKFFNGDKSKAKLENVIDKNSVYEVVMKIGNNNYNSYITKDGKFFFPEGYEVPQNISSINAIPKSDKPDVKLFVMSYCPFGLQAEKAFLPVYDLLKDEASMGIYFVDYAMHGKKEVEENLRQYCIESDQSSKYGDYLECFVKSGDSEACLKSAGIDKEKLSDCISKTDEKYHIMADYNDKSKWISGRYPPFIIHRDLNDKYNVQGSPTLVINDKVVQLSSRSPEVMKETICKAFNNPPSDCFQKLSESVPLPGIGGGESDNNSQGVCK